MGDVAVFTPFANSIAFCTARQSIQVPSISNMAVVQFLDNLFPGSSLLLLFAI